MDLAPEDQAIIAGWWRELLAGDGSLPAGLEPVQTRLIRSVGRSDLPSAGPVFVKVMGFPRKRDRLRYLLRALPALHEARMLATVRAAGVAAPEVLAVRTSRRMGLPQRSLLVLRAMQTSGRRPEWAAKLAVAERLCRAGVFHPDLHPDNFLLLENGEVAVLDLHSARRRRPGLGKHRRIRMAAMMLATHADEPDALEDLERSGLVPEGCAQAVADAAGELVRREVLRRIRRCLTNSSGFRVRRGLTGIRYERRGERPVGHRIDGGPELFRCWIGDRTLQILDGDKPRLFGLFRRSWWFPASCWVYTAATLPGESPREAVVPALLEGYARYRSLARRHHEASFGRPKV